MFEHKSPQFSFQKLDIRPPKNKFLRVSMHDGSVWDVPCLIIAMARADHYYVRNDPEHDAEYEHCLNNTTELFEWAANNMNWREVESYARLVRAPVDCNYEDGWVNGQRSIVEH
jgi:hypothetical protein